MQHDQQSPGEVEDRANVNLGLVKGLSEIYVRTSMQTYWYTCSIFKQLNYFKGIARE